MPFCPKCGKEVSEDTKFCPKCGNRLVKTQSEQTAASALYKEVSAKDEDLLSQTIASNTSLEAQGKTKTAQPETLGDEMKRDLRSWGFALVGMGIISIVLSGFLDPVWGGILIVLGVLCFLIKRRGMYIAIGTGLMLAGIMNIFGGEFGGWTIFGIFQIGFGIYEIRKFWKYALVSGFGSDELTVVGESDKGGEAMPFCPKCGKEVSEDMEFCPECGQKLKEGFTPEERKEYIKEFKASVEEGEQPKKTKMSKKKLAGIIGGCVIAIIVIAVIAIPSEPTPTYPPVTTTYEPPIPAHFTTYTLEGLFSISYPSNWQVITSTMEEIIEDVKGEMETEDPTVYLENITVLFGAGNEISEGYYYPGVSIVTDPRSTGYWTLEEVNEATSLYDRENTPGYKELSVNWTKVDGRDAVIIDSEDNEPGYGRWRYTQMLTVQGDFVWLVTCACEYQDFNGYEDTFHSIVRSLRILN